MNPDAPFLDATRVFERSRAPFPHFLAEQVLAPNIHSALLDWFEGDAPWQLVEQDFYEQFEFSLLDFAPPGAAGELVSAKGLAAMRDLISREFDVALNARTELVAHKLVPGQRIAIHNDFLPGHETHRLTVQLNRGLADEDGGFFMLFGSFDPEDVHRVLRPITNTAVGFEIGAGSHHAVSRMHGSERYTLVYSFYAEHSR